jgi:hypothetical protein
MRKHKKAYKKGKRMRGFKRTQWDLEIWNRLEYISS